MQTPRSRSLLRALVVSVLFLVMSAPAAGLLERWWNWTLGGVQTRLIEVPTAAPVGITACPGVRPGAIVTSDAGQCTFNAAFAGSDGRLYIGTAGHCILGESPSGGDVGEESWDSGTGPMARDGAGAAIGRFAYAILQDPKDFALIELDADVPLDAQMCHFGGPSAMNSDQPSGPVVLHHYGNGVGLGALLPARSGAALGMPHPDHVYAQAAAVPGDSGSLVISDDGRAVGVLVTVGVHSSSIGVPTVDAGIVGITRFAPQVARAEQVLGIDLTLLTAPPL
ncbi:MAG: hypothetical protein ACREI7_06095 [Myxococcota bacterium]